jgi:hypothetical protein
MTSDGQQESVRGDAQLKFIGFLLACSLGLMGWGFNNWSDAVETGMNEVMLKLNRMEMRAEDRDERIYEVAAEIRVIGERQTIMREQLDKHKEQPH